MIIGIGNDLVEINRIRSIYNKFGDNFLNKIYTKKEINFFFKIKTNLFKGYLIGLLLKKPFIKL